MSVIFFYSFSICTCFVLSEVFFYLNFVVYHQNLSIFTNLAISFVAKIPDVNLLNSWEVTYFPNFVRPQSGCNKTEILWIRLKCDLMLSSANLLYRYREFIALVYHYPQFKVNLVWYFFEIGLTHLKQICDNAVAILIYWISYLNSKYAQVINLYFSFGSGSSSSWMCSKYVCIYSCWT